MLEVSGFDRSILSNRAAVVHRKVKLKSRWRGLSGSEMVDRLLAIWAAGEAILAKPQLLR
jgi:hypothetical protein